MFLVFYALRILHQPDHLFMLFILKRAFECDEALGILVMNPQTGRANDLVGVCWLRPLGPPLFVK